MKPRAARWLAVLLWLSWALVGVAHAGTVTYVYTDPQGTPLAEADANGNITATYDYTPYGSPALGAAPNGPGYTGHVNDPETGLVYMQARYYDPVVGRFLSVDPVGPSPGNVFNFNRYDYANNNPIVNIDPNGRLTGSLLHQDEEGVAGSGYSVQIVSGAKQVANLVKATFHQSVKDIATVSGARQPDSLTDGLLAPIRLGILFSPLSLEGGASDAIMEAGASGAAKGVASDAMFAQKTFGKMFSAEGKFGGQSVEDVAAALRGGTLNPAEVPVSYIVRDGQSIILNTRSAQALESAGIPRSAWNGVNKTGDSFFEGLLDGQLSRNPGGPFSTVRPSGGQ